MRVTYIVLLSLILIFAFAGCSNSATTGGESQGAPIAESGSQQTGSESGNDNSQQSGSDADSDKEQIEVDKGLLNTEITLPASMFEGQDIDKVIADAKADGITDVTKNDDGSLTYTMSRDTHKKLMDEAKNGMLQSIEDMKSGQNFKSIKAIVHNDKFSEFTLTVDKAAYEGSFDGFAALGLGIGAMYYQVFDGIKPDDLKVTIQLKDQSSGEVFDTVVYPDAMNEQ